MKSLSFHKWRLTYLLLGSLADFITATEQLIAVFLPWRFNAAGQWKHTFIGRWGFQLSLYALGLYMSKGNQDDPMA